MNFFSISAFFDEFQFFFCVSFPDGCRYRVGKETEIKLKVIVHGTSTFNAAYECHLSSIIQPDDVERQ
jgi:hypothetical protein